MFPAAPRCSPPMASISLRMRARLNVSLELFPSAGLWRRSRRTLKLRNRPRSIDRGEGFTTGRRPGGRRRGGDIACPARHACTEATHHRHGTLRAKPMHHRAASQVTDSRPRCVPSERWWGSGEPDQPAANRLMGICLARNAKRHHAPCQTPPGTRTWHLACNRPAVCMRLDCTI